MMSDSFRPPSSIVFSTPSAEQVRAVLDTDPVWAAYAIADLHPEHTAYCTWHLGETVSNKAITLLYTRLETPILFAMGDTVVLDEILENSDLPSTLYINLREEHIPLIERAYDFPDGQIPMWRMGLTDPSVVMGTSNPLPNVRLVNLTSKDAKRIHQLHANGGQFAPDMFEPHQTEGGTFFGVEDDAGQLLANGGSHVVDWQAGVTSIGVMYTHPDHRGQGYASAILQAVIEKLRQGGVSNIVLNVDQRNEGAIRLYQRHGFEIYCPYIEGVGYRKR